MEPEPLHHLTEDEQAEHDAVMAEEYGAFVDVNQSGQILVFTVSVPGPLLNEIATQSVVWLCDS
jgi:hypothetical protein